MALLLEPLVLEDTQPNQRFPALDIRLSRARAPSGVRLTLLHPEGERALIHRRYVGLLRVRAGDGRTARGHAQILATRRRILGLIMAGDLAGRSLGDADRVVAGFSVDRSELASIEVMRTSATGVGRVRFRGGAGDPFLLDVEMIVARLGDSARGARASLADFLLGVVLSGLDTLQLLVADADGARL